MDASGGWMVDAACKDVDWKIFFANVEAEEPEPEAIALCDPCPVRVECMTYALVNDQWGTWAGTSYFQRRQLRRRYRRLICPRCHEQGGVVEIDGGQVCRWCAVSWRATPTKERAGG